MSNKEEDEYSRRQELMLQDSFCPSCGHAIPSHDALHGDDKVIALHNLPGLPAGVKFDPTDQELLEHLESKVKGDSAKLHPLLHNFIPMIQGEEGICYTHPEKLPGLSMDGLARHFFHYPSKAYTTGTRKRRKVQTDEQGGETRWHKTGKTRPILVDGKTKGHKKILVLYTNYGRLKKPGKTNWVMHQYHLGSQEEEKEGELVVSKVFYQTQPRQSGVSNRQLVEYYCNPVKEMMQSHHLSMSQSSSPHQNPRYDSNTDFQSRISPPQLINTKNCLFGST